ncbi:tumor necrosis factor receptor superfamily member 1A-like isoform X2 [Hyperolius riggenbachi]|uniref:tumor necrosis factor receptor superfamily member 1A-like isoform X2 n=1 Tax=Hyperolius riggenbachi TaxID=752182 RepID=UPI0035A2FEBA
MVMTAIPIAAVTDELKNESLNRKMREIKCGEDEYESEGICCHRCSAGTHVFAHCTEDHAPALCHPCSPGKSYMAAPNGLTDCWSCRVCRDDEDQVKGCSATSDVTCQCKKGSYCIPGDPCEICNHCSRCREGQRIKEPCSPTSDTVCEDIPEGQPTSDTSTLPTEPPTSAPRHVTNVTSPPETDLTTKDGKPGEGNTFWVEFIVVLVILIVVIIVVSLMIWWRWYSREQEKRNQKNASQSSLMGGNTGPPTANPSQQSTPHFDRADAAPRVPVQEQQRLLQAEDDTKGEEESGENVVEVLEASCEERLQAIPDNDRDPDADEGGGGGGAFRGGMFNGCRQARDCDWPTFFYCVIDNVPASSFLRFARQLGLRENDIQYIIKENSNNLSEQYYKILEKWREQAGRRASMATVIRILREMEMNGPAENITNNLRSKGIRIL